jgi:hypothetical protein
MSAVITVKRNGNSTPRAFADGWACSHAVCGCTNVGDVVLCEACADALDAGAKIEKSLHLELQCAECGAQYEKGRASKKCPHGHRRPGLLNTLATKAPIFVESTEK